MNVILIGFMGTGKSAVGKRLAKRLGWTFVDVDERIEAVAKMKIVELFAEKGEPVFRRLERRTIGRVVRGTNQVIATGGGAFLDPKNRSRLRVSGPVICLTARPRVILKRVERRLGTRPLLSSGTSPQGRIQELMARRAPTYAQADLTIDTSDLTLAQAVERLWLHLGPYLCKSWHYLRDHARELAARYGGKYVVVADDRVLASGASQLEAYQKACEGPASGSRPARLTTKQQDAGVYYIPLPEESVTAFAAQ